MHSMSSMKTNTYPNPSVGCYLDHANYNVDELNRRIIELARSFGYQLDIDAQAALAAADADEAGEDCDVSEMLDWAADAAIDWLNDQEQRPFLYWANEGEANAFGLWPNVEGAREDVGFVSSRNQEYPADDYEGEWLHVSDHGNATLYMRTNGQDSEVWSVV